MSKTALSNYDPVSYGESSDISGLLEEEGRYTGIVEIEEPDAVMPFEEDVLVVIDYSLFPVSDPELEELVEGLEESGNDFVVPPGKIRTFPDTILEKEKVSGWVNGYGKGIHYYCD